MNRLALTAFVSIALLVASVPRAHAEPAADPGAVVDDIKAAYEKGEYTETLRLVGKVLALKGKAAAGYDRYELLMLRAEAHLRLKATAAAIAALEESAKAAPDDRKAAESKALVMLIKRSKALQYTPRVPGGTGKAAVAGDPIDITDVDKRPEAFEALYLEEKVAAKPKVQAADKAKTLPPLATALKVVVPLKSLELAANGKDVETAAQIKDLVDSAHKLMSKSLNDMSKRTSHISERANEIVQYESRNATGGTDIRTSRRGLNNEERKELKATIDTCKKIIDNCKELAEGFTDDAEPFEDLIDLSMETAETANDVVNDNYSRIR